MKRLLSLILIACTLVLFEVPVPYLNHIHLVALAASGQLNKTAFEQVDLSLDFTPRAQNGITLVAVQMIKTQTSADVSSSMIAVTPAPTVIFGTNKVYVRVIGGLVGDKCNLAIRISKNDTGEQLEGNIIVQVISGI